MKQQTTLFKEAPLRLKNGKYCTKEQYRTDKAIEENKILRMEKEKYFRMAMALSESNSRLERELAELKEKIGGLING